MSTTTQERAGPRSLPGNEVSSKKPKSLRKRAVDWLNGDSSSRILLLRSTVAGWMNILILAAAATTVVTAGFLAGNHWPDQQTWGAGALKLFALWCLAFLPGWLYVRFLDLRAKALWNEYVLNLHRLGWDLPWNLPEPPAASASHKRWALANRSTWRAPTSWPDARSRPADLRSAASVSSSTAWTVRPAPDASATGISEPSAGP